jgi:hypothetical protein
MNIISDSHIMTPTGANFSDHSTAPEAEKVRRVLQHLADGDSVYFYSDGYPRYTDLQNDVRACLKVWAAITTGPSAPAAPAPTETAAYHATIASFDDHMKDPVRRVLAEQAGELPPLPELDTLADIAYTHETPPAWDADYQRTWLKLQLAERNKMQWRVYALQLRAALAARQAPTKPTAQNEDGNNYCRILTILGMEEEGDPVAEVQRLFDMARQAPDSRADRTEPWTDEQRDQFRRDQKTGPRCDVCSVVLGGPHFPTCSKEGT